ncbi:site-specific integrase [Rhodomicrobium vannielii ATCC 17100]|uniref:tyrosine-type recombinase/integrase n=1 Tax=Rhodomicrobium vannielii TaxID=1069 RepID=UPI00191B8240|nr:site-specific integrase [Rhodomicrobium vannielii]MBJ7533265.1 site-specific integrase [Rhodomicrobium vannielii ATCC 17100]
MRDKITKRTIDALKQSAQAGGKALYCFDTETPGFGAVATKTGTCSYFIEYRLGGRGTPSKRVTIGKHGVVTPDEARRIAKEELGKVARGTDVAQVKKDTRAKLTGQTFADAAKRFLDLREEPGRYAKEKRARLLHSDDVSPIAKKPLALITRADIMAVIDTAAARSPSAALVLHSHIRTVFAWAVSRSLIETDPSFGVPAPPKSKARDRVLSDDELRAFWQAAGEQSWPFANIFKLLLLTAQRREEVAGMQWAELDLDAANWTIAKERCKNGKTHTIDLHPSAIALLDPLGEAMAARVVRARAWAAEGSDEIVFTTTGQTSVSGFSKAKERIDARMKEILGDRFKPWRTHDLRRTAASGMAALGFQPHIIERVLNHVSGAQGGLVGVYQRHEYRDERKRAILAWGDHVARLVSDKAAAPNVVPLRVA